MPKFIFLLFLSLTSLAQIQKDYIEYLEDETGVLGIENVIKSPKFKVSKNKIPSLGIAPHAVWTKLSVKNNEQDIQEYYAQILLPYMDTVQYFVFTKNKVVSLSNKMGWWSNIDNKHYYSPNHPYEFTLQPNESAEIYARTIKTHGTVRIPFQIDTRVDFLQSLYVKNTFFGWFLGMMFLMVLLNIFMYILLWERVYLVYSLYIICQTFVFVLREGFHSQIFNRGFGPITGLNFYYIGLILMAVSNLLFVHTLLRVKEFQPKIVNYFYRFLIGYGLLLAALQFFPFGEYNISKTNIYTNSLTISFLGSLGLCLAMLIFAFIKNKERKSAILYSISGIPLLFLASVQILANMQVFPVTTAYRGVYLILAIAFEMIVLCFWLALRFKQFSDEREKLLREKTKQQQIALETGLKLQNQERSRLAKELHDGLGIDISIIKMKLEALGLDFEKKGISAKEFSETIANLDSVASNVRSFSHNIMPPDLEKNGIAVVLENLVNNLQKLNSNIELNFTTNITEKLEDDLSQNLYFIAKELINNALRHSGSTIIDVELMKENNRTELKVSDNGIGYDYEKSLKKDGIGLESIKSRVALINANLEVTTKPSNGISHKISHFEKEL